MASNEESIKGLPDHVKEYPRVSHVLDYTIATSPRIIEWALRFYEDGGHPIRYMEDKADKGTFFHNMMEAFAINGPLTPPEEWKGEYESTVKALEEYKGMKIMPEKKLWCECHKVRGTCDLMVEIKKGEWIIIDYKTGRHRRTHPVQLLFYRHMAKQHGYNVVAQYAWHPMKTKVNKIRVPYDGKIVDAVMTLYDYLEE